MNASPTMLCPASTRGPRRTALLLCGWCNVALGMVGVVVPGMPTTVFLLIAAWAFSKNSPRFSEWLYRHPRFGPALCQWRDHRVISVRAKCAAIFLMGLSLIVMVALSDAWPMPVALGLVLTLVGTWIVTRPSQPASA
ncbi:MAG: YbaN family protein [Alphaproteobacteria bacterium]|jgi:hypothetical protein|nr:YbaN family protein [Alphaproteobacteria bacterium]